MNKVLQQLGLHSKAAYKFKYKTDSDSGHNMVPNKLNREFYLDKSNIVWVSDITYIKTGEGWLYLCVIIDLYGLKQSMSRA